MPKRLTADEVRQVKKLLKQTKLAVVPKYSNAEIASRQGCSVPTVERRLAIIRRLLQRP